MKQSGTKVVLPVDNITQVVLLVNYYCTTFLERNIMPSKLPIIKANTSDENIIKMKYIAKWNKRSLAKELEYIVEKHIAEFEEEHGTIEIDWMSPQEIVQDISDRIIGNPPYEQSETIKKIAKAVTDIKTDKQ